MTKKQKIRPFRVTHIDRGVEPATVEDVTGQVLVDPKSGRWPKVSFSTGETYSYAYLTNTKIVYFTRNNQEMFTDPTLDVAMRAFMESDRPYNESNWNTQKKRVTTWKPEDYKTAQISKNGEVLREATGTLAA